MKKLQLFIILLIGFSSCTKEEITSDSPVDKGIAVSNIASDQLPCSEYEMLTFDSMDEFRGLMNQVNAGARIQDILSIDFYSLADSYSKDGVQEMDDFLHDRVLASVLSPEGEIKIEDMVYKISNETVLMYSDCTGKASSLNYVNNPGAERIFESKGELVEQNESFSVFIPKHEISTPSRKRASESHILEFEENKFIMGKMWKSSYFVYSSIGVETKVVELKNRWNGPRLYEYPVDEVTVEWDVHFDINPIASGPFPNILDCSNSQCALACSSTISDIGSKTEENSHHVKHLFDWAVGIGVSLSGGNFLPGVPANGTSFSYWRHRDDQNCLSNHSAVVDGQTFTLPTLYWNPCDEEEIEEVDCIAPTHLKVETVSCGTYRLTIRGEGNYSITDWDNTNTSPSSTQTSSPSLIVTVPNPGTNSRIRGKVLCTESNSSQYFDFDFTRLIGDSDLDLPYWDVYPPYYGSVGDSYDIQLSNPPLGNGEYDISWESTSGIDVTPSSSLFSGKANMKLVSEGYQTITVKYIDLCDGTETVSTTQTFVQL